MLSCGRCELKFKKLTTSRSAFPGVCLKCQKYLINKRWTEENPDKQKAKDARYIKNNPEKKKAADRKRYERKAAQISIENKEKRLAKRVPPKIKVCSKCGLEVNNLSKGVCLKCYFRDYDAKRKDARKEYMANYQKVWASQNRDKTRAANRKHYRKNPQGHTNRNIKWKTNNPDKVKAMQKRKRIKDELKPFTKAKRQLRNGVNQAFMYLNSKKSSPTLELLGISKEALIAKRDSYMGKPCECGLACGGTTIITVENSHCDHIKPLNLVECYEDVIQFNQLENLRWICITCNLKKSGKYN